MLIALIVVPLVLAALAPAFKGRLWLAGLVMLALTAVATRTEQTVTVPWWPPLHLSLALVTNATNVPLLWLSAVLLLAVGFVEEELPTPSPSLVLIAIAGANLAFTATAPLMFFLGFELAVLPFYLLIYLVGGPQRRRAALFFLAFSATASVPLLWGMIWLTIHGVTIFHPARVPLAVQEGVYLALLLTWAIKTPLWPFHVWLPRAHGQASTPVSMLLAGISLKIAPYGLILADIAFPAAARALAPWLALWGGANVLAGGLLALGRRDLKETVAYSSLASMGFVIIGLAVNTPFAREMAILVMVGHGVASAFLFWATGAIAHRTGTRQLDKLAGLYVGSPDLARWMTLGVLGYMGMPGLALFPGEVGVITAAIGRYPWAVGLALAGWLVAAAVWIRVLARIRFGQQGPVAVGHHPRLGPVPGLLTASMAAMGVALPWVTALWNWR
ncbi:MAG: proton-conducting transporter membrane subunit [Firmicutes bacterium]|nr:proton-conducting transporter membrane subunit [Bacillota bacterium]